MMRSVSLILCNFDFILVLLIHTGTN